MKKIVAALFVLCFSVILCGGLFFEKHCDLYALSGVVVELETESDSVVFEDFNGNLWAFEGIEDWFVGDIVAAVMADHGTRTIYDDEIVSVRYCGYTE